MCDYSLESVRSRPAKVGDKLTTRDFGTGTRGFAGAEDRASGGLCSAGDRACIFQRGDNYRIRFVIALEGRNTMSRDGDLPAGE